MNLQFLLNNIHGFGERNNNNFNAAGKIVHVILTTRTHFFGRGDGADKLAVNPKRLFSS